MNTSPTKKIYAGSSPVAPTMCEWGTYKLVSVKIPADLSFDGKEHWKEAKIDACIAPIVEALQKAGIDMRGSCCGHGEGVGDIHLQDGRALIILSPIAASRYYSKRGRSSKVRTVV